MKAIDLLLSRNSAPKLKSPAPDEVDMEFIYQAAMRAPDHARLRPWRFLAIKDQGREVLGDLFAEALKLRNPSCSENDLNKVRSQPLRAPLLVVVIARLVEHAKVPESEQVLSAGCAAHSMLLAAQALGYAGIWRTGDNAFDRSVMRGLSMADNEQVVGFLYLGSLDGSYKPLPRMNSSDFVQPWP